MKTALILAAAISVAFTVGHAAQAAPVTVEFESINSACSYTESGYNFACSGNHTDSSNQLYFHNYGANPGLNDILVTFSGGNFKATSLQVVALYDALQITDNLGHVYNIGTTGTFVLTGFDNVSWLKLSTDSNGGSGVVLDDFTFDDPATDVPEPGSLALLGLGLLGALGVRRRAAE